MFIDLQCVGRAYSDRNAGQPGPREIMRIIVKIMRIIVLEQCIRLPLSLLYACHPVDAVELAFFIDTNQSFLGEWVRNC